MCVPRLLSHYMAISVANGSSCLPQSFTMQLKLRKKDVVRQLFPQGFFTTGSVSSQGSCGKVMGCTTERKGRYSTLPCCGKLKNVSETNCKGP